MALTQAIDQETDPTKKLKVTNQAAVQAENPTPVQPVLGEVKPEATVAGQIDSIIKQDSPLTQSARTSAKQQMNSRGLINSSMALQAGEKAVIDSALPIAQQDATTHYDQAKTNQSAQNTFRQNEQAFDMNKALKEQEQRFSLEGKAADQDYALERMGVDQINTLKRMDVEQANKIAYAHLENQLGMEKDANTYKLMEHLESVKTNAQISAEMKRTFAIESSRIMDTTQQAIKEIGLSNQSAAQQANAVQQMLNQRNASIDMLKSLMLQTQSWSW